MTNTQESPAVEPENLLLNRSDCDTIWVWGSLIGAGVASGLPDVDDHLMVVAALRDLPGQVSAAPACMGGLPGHTLAAITDKDLADCIQRARNAQYPAGPHDLRRAFPF